MTEIKATKMQGLGNDFVIVDFEEYKKSNMPMEDFAIKVCDRHFGLGADGLIIPNLTPENSLCDIGWYFYNSDGTIAEMCGNGIRCFAKYVYDKKIVQKTSFKVETKAGIIEPEIVDADNIKVKMSIPTLEPKKIPYNSETILNNKIKVLDKEYKINAISMGNPHCIIITEEQDGEKLLEYAKKYGPEIEKHSLFPKKTNVEFISIKNKSEINLRVWERGCGITLACGTGACASVVACILNNLTESKVKVNLAGGALNIEWDGSMENPNHHVFMTGPANYSYFANMIL